MKNLLVLILGLFLSLNTAFATRYVTQTYTTPNYNNYNYNPSVYNQANLYDVNSARLSEVEQSLYGRTYENQNSNVRLNRLEKSVFNKTYPASPFEQRMNNLIMNYNNNYQNNYSQISTRGNKINNLINGLNGMFYGTPTGFTPQIQPFGMQPNWGHRTDYVGSNGWARRNYNVGSGMGVRIID